MPKKFVVRVSGNFARSLDELPPEQALEVAEKLKILEVVPLPTGKNRIKKIKGFKPALYRLRIGNKRMLYRVLGAEVALLKIIDRKDLERELRKFPG